MAVKYSDAVATIAIIIAFGSAYFSYRSSTFAERQSVLAGVQTRPYVRYKPVFEESGSDKLGVIMIRENLSAVPAKTVYDELRTWVDGVSSGVFLVNRTGDALYEHHNGSSDLPALPKELSKAAIAGKAKIMIGTCIVYSSLSSADNRRWEVRALYSYEPKSDLPTVQYIQESAVEPGAQQCDSAGLWSEWVQAKQQSISAQTK